eukprot:CAMPEP_0117016116 /NCGR_PEP_ID=MMETSP0472-20121206/12743_1 /TAXON_ID=693140 ORGANISM="Tiarina fusus, Strain LIS" /NCGR_SAMPLE_ID=MMETSP0472 /ASSEMBLY_ACC=CAM_ASM_000603 /LENGTH=670 /DNA_ID=CAMNT_0004720057 /DNA_START=160 /DNA_END=2172 /DNA_ORIENTATION=+
MKDYFDRSTYSEIIESLDNKEPLSAEMIKKFAKGAHRWATDRDCTHLTHVFQPLSGTMGEKHDIMFSVDEEGLLTSSLSPNRFLSGEPDASSFPNDGTRPTHQARGNTIWDPRSSLTIAKLGNACTLRIPSIFYGWNNMSMDFKTPLLRSEDALQKSTLKVLHTLGQMDHTRVDSYCGLEQEFFLLDEEFYNKRPDLIATGRTLLGRDASRGQDHSDRYFGWQTTRAQNCIYEMETEFWKLGIPNSTRHREVAPGQFEMAPTYQGANQANDNNLIMMQVMKEVAKRHKIVCLFHEKPFANLNGSGKHNNWSIGTNVDPTFFSPKSPNFLLSVAAFVRGVHLYGDLLRCSVSTSGNDHRLGGHEAPPGIMSIYLGADVRDMVDRAIRGEDSSFQEKSREIQDFGVSYLPHFNRQSCDRNRTSPIAFCDNRFEFRAVGSSVNTAWSTTILNTITADSMEYMACEIKEAKAAGDPDPLKTVIAKTLKAHQAVLFEGDNYSPEWVAEAARRSLPNIPNTCEALKVLSEEKVQTLFQNSGVLSKAELAARSGIFFRNFCLDVTVELRCLVDMTYQLVIPSGFKQLKQMSDSKNAAPQLKKTVSELVTELQKAIAKCKDLDNKLVQMPESECVATADFIQNEVRPAMDEVRKISDSLEGYVDASLWPLPSYHQMLN